MTRPKICKSSQWWPDVRQCLIILFRDLKVLQVAMTANCFIHSGKIFIIGYETASYNY